MKAMQLIAGLLALFVTLPIWFYLMFKILQGVNATELMWFLYWIYLPAHLFMATVQKVAEISERA